MFRTAFLQRRNEPGRLDYRKAATTPPVRARFLAILFLKNFDSAVKAASVLPRNDFGLSPCPRRSTLIVSANSERGGRQ